MFRWNTGRNVERVRDVVSHLRTVEWFAVAGACWARASCSLRLDVQAPRGCRIHSFKIGAGLPRVADPDNRPARLFQVRPDNRYNVVFVKHCPQSSSPGAGRGSATRSMVKSRWSTLPKAISTLRRPGAHVAEISTQLIDAGIHATDLRHEIGAGIINTSVQTGIHVGELRRQQATEYQTSADDGSDYRPRVAGHDDSIARAVQTDSRSSTRRP